MYPGRSDIGIVRSMLRYLTPLMFAAATAWMWHYNGTHDDSKLVLPLVDVIVPEAAGDPAALADASLIGAAGLTALVFVLTVVGHARDVWHRQRMRKTLEPKSKPAP